jgi:TolB-like protein
VLPFENLSDEKERLFRRQYQDDVLTNLSKIGDLKVISIVGYAISGKASNLREIGKALGVAT